MSWISILPPSLVVVETWLVRLFILLGVLTIGPWAIFLTYDLVLYVFRSITYDLPYVGGHARGRQRPRAPSLTERPNGEPRRFSISINQTVDGEPVISENLKSRLRQKAEASGEEAIHED